MNETYNLRSIILAKPPTTRADMAERACHELRTEFAADWEPLGWKMTGSINVEIQMLRAEARVDLVREHAPS